MRLIAALQRPEAEICNDLAADQVLKSDAGIGSMFNGVKRRHRLEANNEFLGQIVGGYQTGRVMLGTHLANPVYSVGGAAVDANGAAIEHAASAIAIEDVIAALQGDAREAFERIARDVAGKGVLGKDLGRQEAFGILFTALVTGLRYAIAEQDLFGL